jgi:hypothetical protein
VHFKAICAVFAALQVVGGDAAITLRYSYKSGQAYRYEVRQSLTWESTLAGSKQVSQVETRTVREWRATATDAGGNARLTLTILRLQIDAALPDGSKRVVDSDKDGAHPLAAVVGKPVLDVTLNPSGRILALQPRQGSGTEQLAAHVRVLAVPLPAAPVTAGTRWQNDFELVMPPPVGSGEKYTARHIVQVEKLDGTRATLNMQAVLTEEIKERATLARLAQFLPQGKIEFDAARGLMIRQDLMLDQTITDFAGKDSSVRIRGTYQEQLVESVAANRPSTR